MRVLIVEDSPTARAVLVHIFESAPETEVAGIAHDGEEAIEAVERLNPDVITMDINMPRMNGFEATERIMQTRPIPIIIVSGSYPSELRTTFEALQVGAIAVLPRPQGIGHPQFEESARELVRTARLMSEVKLVRRRPRPNLSPSPAPPPADATQIASDVGIVAIGASTGGPMVLQKILSGLPADIPFPIVIVQHMACGFLEGFVEWLGKTTKIAVQVAKDREKLQPGVAYFAPDSVHLEITPGGVARLKALPPDNGLRPSVARLFRSVQHTYGSLALGVLLTGMGADGARELKDLLDVGAMTIAQDSASSIVNGMPGEAVALGGARKVLPPEAISEYIARVAKGMREKAAKN